MWNIHRIWNDISRGENIDLYSTVSISILLVSLNLLGFVPSNTLSTLSVAVLALLSISMLGNRYRLEKLLSSDLGQHELLLLEYPKQLINEIRDAKDLVIIGNDLRKSLKDHYSLLLEKLRIGHRIRVVIVNPDSPASELSVLLHYEPISIEAKKLDILRSCEICNELKERTSGSIELRLANHVPTFGAYALDIDTPHSSIYIKQYRYKSPLDDVPIMHLRPEMGVWFDVFRNEVEAVWKDATPVTDRAFESIKGKLSNEESTTE